jgi:hypothetical protein
MWRVNLVGKEVIAHPGLQSPRERETGGGNALASVVYQHFQPSLMCNLYNTKNLWAERKKSLTAKSVLDVKF